MGSPGEKEGCGAGAEVAAAAQRDLCCSWGCSSSSSRFPVCSKTCGLEGCGINPIPCCSWREAGALAIKESQRSLHQAGDGLQQGHSSPGSLESHPAAPRDCPRHQPAPEESLEPHQMPPDLHFGVSPPAPPCSTVAALGFGAIPGHGDWGVPGLPSWRGLRVSNPIPESLRAVRDPSCPAGTEWREGNLGRCRAPGGALGSDFGIKPQVSNNETRSWF